MPKYDLQLYWNHTSAWVFSCKFAANFRTHFLKNTSGGLLLALLWYNTSSIKNYLIVRIFMILRRSLIVTVTACWSVLSIFLQTFSSYSLGLSIYLSWLHLFKFYTYLHFEGFDLSFWGDVMKTYPFATLCWVNKDKSIKSNIFSLPIGHYISHSYGKQIWTGIVITCLREKFGINLPSSFFWNFEISRIKRGRLQNFKKWTR